MTSTQRRVAKEPIDEHPQLNHLRWVPDHRLAQQATQQQASIVEPRAISEGVASDEMFLSPRVLDAGAFSRYSELLKSIIAQSTAQGRTLEDFSADADAMIKRCDASSENINKRMQSGLRMIKMIDERAERTELLLEQLSAIRPDSQQFAQRIDQMIEERMSKAEARIEQIASDALARVQAADQRAAAAEQRAQQAIAQNETHASELDALSTRVEGQLSELESRIENTRKETTTTLDEILERTATVTKNLNSSLDQVLSRAHESGANLAAKIDEASRLTDSRLSEMTGTIAPMLEASQQVIAALGMDPQNPKFDESLLARIDEIAKQGEAKTASLEAVYKQLDELQSQADETRSVFSEWLVNAASELDVLETRKDSLVGPMSEAADKVAQIAPDLEYKLELASTQLTHLQTEQQTLRQTIQSSSQIANEVSSRMANESSKLQALLDGSINQLSARVEQAGQWLGVLIQRAEAVSQADQRPSPQASAPEPVSAPAPAAAPTPAPAPAAQTTPAEPAPTPKPPAAQAATTQAPTAQAPSKYEPLPPSLPIDAISFEGASAVFEHQSEDSASA